MTGRAEEGNGLKTDVLDRLKPALADCYTIERELGRGGMAVVYLAHGECIPSRSTCRQRSRGRRPSGCAAHRLT